MAEEHAQKLATVVVGQLADVCGYERAHKNALNAAADVMMRFIKEVGVYAKEAAEQQGRTDANALDVVRTCGVLNFPRTQQHHHRTRMHLPPDVKRAYTLLHRPAEVGDLSCIPA